MAKKVSFNDIPDKHTDWGLDESNGFPYSGQSVQKYIKESLDGKAGIFYYDMTNNRYLVFGDAENRDIYLNDPTRTDLLIGTFDAPFNYTAEITMLTPSYNAIFLGSTGNYIDFTFDIKNKQGASTGENVNVTYTFIRNATKKVVTETRRYGEAVHFNVDDYLLEGSNTIIVGITGQTTLAATTVALTYNVVNLTLTDEMDISKVYDLSNGAQTMEVFFTVTGSGTKTVEWYLDGVQLDFVKSEDEVVDVTSSRTKYITLSNLSNGAHHLQIRAYTLINGEKFYTDTHYREIIIQSGSSTSNVVAVATDLPYTHGIVNESNPLVFYGAEQYLPYEVRFATLKTADVSIYLGDNLLATVTSTSGRESSYSIVSNKAGTMALKFVVGGVEREIPVAIENTSLNIEEITTALAFDFSARGKSNASTDKDSWSYGGYVGTFEGFNWNASSGWVDNALLINSGASFSVNIAPLALDATSTGKTLEFEFATRNVENDEAIVCDLIGSNGAGLLITASEARLVSAAGEVVSTKFKSGETNRIAFVVNRKTGTTYKGLAFIYVNGILSGAINFGSADNFISPLTLSFSGSEDAQVELRSMRFYDTALSSENVLNNYTLYRDTLNEMMDVYYRNDIYEDGTSSFSPYKAQHRLPVMIVTGDIPTLESATSTSTQITVDITYTNEQDPSKSFTMKDAAMRIQGTSSLAYPRKNFRIYTTKVDSTIVYDAEGKVIEDKLYSFKDGAQPVDCWCLKADYAESSGTHNTGIARIWNEAMYNAQIQYTNVLGEEVNGYALRTEAQKAAISANYGYDVRTTIDGFPILLFYKKNESDTDLIFLGKYNFNNDKATPSVFGFENIPNFDNSRMQCWETKDNGNPLGLFTDISGFDANWTEAYESRYPDTSTPNTADLKAFSLWVNGVSQSAFVTEKWAHLDVYKVAAYYVYLMRFGAVDQVVKNGFITSEDGAHFFYINYDNDTINGLINTGELRLDPEIDRQTIGSDGEYVYAGHSSVLWNLLEADSEFMDIVKVVDNALFSSGLRYDRVIEMFNDEQAAKWVERVYNQDAEYKYLLPYANAGTNNLFMLQGSRSSHRSWWLSKRFSLYDSLFVSGNYRDRNISFKCLNDTQPGQQFTITAGTAMNYGYGVNNGTREVGIALAKGESRTFTTTDTLNLGDVVKIFAAANIQGIDLSALASRLAVLDLSAAYDPALGSKLKNLILGSTTATNTELGAISGIGVLEGLQLLNIEGYKGLTEIDLTKQKDFRKLYAKGSNISSVDFSKGAPVDHLELPASMLALNLQQLPYLTTDNLVLEDNSNIYSIRIEGCPNLSNDFSLISAWASAKTTEDAQCSIIMDNVVWDNVTPDGFMPILNIKVNGGTLDLKGRITMPTASLEVIQTIERVYGEEVFDEDNDLYIKVPSAVYMDAPVASINEGESATFVATVYPAIDGTMKYSLTNSRTGASIDENTGVLTTTENGLATSSLTVKATFTPADGSAVLTDTASISIVKRVYPTSSSVTINGNANPLEEPYTYTWSTTTANVNGNMTAVWALSGDITTVAEIESQDSTKCVLKAIGTPMDLINGTLTLTLKKVVDGSTVATATKSLQAMMEGVIITSTTNPGVQAALYNAGLVANENYTLKEEAEAITAEQLQPGTSYSTSIFYAQRSNITSFDEFKYFTGLTTVPTYLFFGSSLESIELPQYIEELGGSCFRSCNRLSAIIIPPLVKNIKNYAFYGCSTLAKVVLSESLKIIETYAFSGCKALKSITIPDSVETIGDQAFSSCPFDEFNIGENSQLSNIDYKWCGDYAPESFRIPSKITTLPQAFIDPKNLKYLSGGESVNYIHPLALLSLSPIEGITCVCPNFGLYSYIGPTLKHGTNEIDSSSVISVRLVFYKRLTFTLSYWYLEDGASSITVDFTNDYHEGIKSLNTYINPTRSELTINSNLSASTFEVSYENTYGETTTIEVSAGIATDIFNIYYGTTINISPNDIDGYVVNPSNNLSPSFNGYALTINFVEKVALYIQHIDGTLYTIDEWTAAGYDNDQANGVALVSASTSFVIAKANASSSYLQWGGYNKTITDIVTATTTVAAVLNFDGEGNTTKIIAQLAGTNDGYVDGAPAAEACAAYTFPNGKKGYMGALGQWQAAYNNKTAVNSAMSLIGGTSISESYYWSSTQLSATNAWSFYWRSGNLNSNSKTSYTPLVRAFAAL